MDKNETLERRFSLNMTHLPNPIAESTCLNLNGSTTRNALGGLRSAAGEFRWGGSPISPKNRSNASKSLNNTSAVHKSRSTATSPQRARMNLSKIDPRIYADVQSRGLVSRIVQYHENGARLNRSMSANNIYSKSGQHSIAQLQKNELPYRATQQSVAMTRIAPPKKSVFYGNTLSSLLRSNSVISVHKSDEELSCENRPILHPPPSENDLAPTRSVLDVLKEISRKRINSDDADGVHDVNKKYCNRDCNDAPFEQAAPHFTDQRNISLHGMGTAAAAVPPAPGQSYKRQREQMLTPQQQQPTHYTQQLNSIPNGIVSVSGRSPLHAQHSPPEQMAKKRICNYNNDITSSLSSSLIHANKRKFYEQQQRSTMQHSPPSALEEYEAQKSKIQRQQADLRLQQLTKSLSCNTPITPLPTTPLNVSANVPALSGNIENKTNVPAPEPTAMLLKHTLSEPPRLNVDFPTKPQKPKLTLFNRNYNNEPQALNNTNGNKEDDNDVDNGECADIQFVKPKKSSSIINKKNPLIERTQKSKLAMMLSGLRGEIYQGEEGDDEVDKNNTNNNITKQTKSLASNEKNTVVNAMAPVTNFVMNTTDKSVNSSSVTVAVSSTSVTTTSAAGGSTTTTSTSIATTTTTSTVGSFKLTASPTSTSSSSVSTNVSPSTASTAATKATSPLVGIKLTPQKQVLDTNGKPSAPPPTFNFGGTSSTPATDTTKSVAGTIATGVGAVPQLQGFSFGLAAKSNASTDATLTTTTVVTATPATTATTSSVGGFKFDTAQSKTSTQTATSAITTTTAAAAPTFGSFANVNASSTATTVSAEAPKPAFAFGSGAVAFTTGTATTTASKPAFNIAANTTTTAPTTTATPSFGAIAASTFTFGGAANNPAAPSTLSQATNPLGGGAAATNNAFAIPSTASTTTSNAFAVPSSASTTNTFAFGATAATTTASATTNAIFGGTAAASSSSTPATNNLFAFGGDKSAAPSATTTAPTTNPTPFAFGANTQKAATAATTSSSSVNNSVFGFGAAGGSATSNPLSNSAANNTNPSSGNLFAFGATKSTLNQSSLFGNNTAATNNTQPPASTAASQSSAFTFGAVAAQASTPAFGGGNAIVSPPAFGAPPKVTASTSFTFGGGGATANKPSAASTMGTPNNAAPATGGFSFGASNNTNPLAATNNVASSNIFGAAASTLANNSVVAVPSNTNIVKPTFNFGGGTATNTNTNTNDAANKSIFGGAAANTNTNNNPFGGFAAAAASNNTANSSFGFNANATSNNAATNNPFAAAASKPAAGGFAFNTNSTNNKPAAAATPSAPFAFGAAANNAAVPAASTNSTAFNFGGSNTNNSSGAPPNKTFTFGSSTNSNNSASASTLNAGSIFGGGGVTQTANNTQQATVSPFSFSSANTVVAAPAPAAGNIFAPPPVSGTGASGEQRPIRRATRRLQKT